MELVERALVRLFRDGRPVGVGFLVGDGLVLTCAHLVADDHVELDFPVLGERCSARVVHRTADPDVAGLLLDRVPARARALRVVAADEVRDHRVRTFGVPDRRPDGVWSQGVVRGSIANGRLHIEDDRAHGLPMLRGFSGSPVLDDDLGAVVGMVVEVEARREHRIGYALTGSLLHDAWPDLAAPQPSPFRGLEPFQREDAEYFFGREEDTRELAERLDRDGVAVVTGPSGCGKSSLVLAGLLAELDVPAIVVRPATGSSPGAALAAALQDDRDAEDALNHILVRDDIRRLVLVVDQLDEALARFPDETADLLATLLAVVDSHRRTPRIDLVVTTTAEPLDTLLADTRFGAALARRTTTVGTAELREVIEGPLAPVGMPVLENGLTETLLDDLADERNPLPLLEFTLTLLWERQERGVLTHRAYRELGGVAGAVAGYAEQVWRRFDPNEVRHALTQLVSPLESGGYVRRAVAPDELGPIATELARTRLVTLRSSTVELAHEALVRHWKRLRHWVEQDRDFRMWQDDLDRTANRWHDTRDRALLLRGKALRHALERSDRITDRQRELVTASSAAAARRFLWRMIAVVTTVSLVASLTFVLNQMLDQQRTVAANNAAEALLTRSRVADPPGEQAVNAVRAYRTVDRLDTRESLRGHSRSLRYAELALDGSAIPNPSGTRIARTTDIWSLNPETSTVATDGKNQVWLGDDLVATHDDKGPITIRDARTGAIRHTIDTRADLVAGDRTGRYIAYAERESTELHLRDLTAGEITLTLPGGFLLVGVLPSGEAVVDDDTGVVALAPDGSRRPLSRGFSEDLPERPEPTHTLCYEGDLSIIGAFSGATLARVTSVTCKQGVFSPDAKHAAVIEQAESDGPEILRVGPVDGRLRAIQVPDGFAATRLAVEPDGTYRVILHRNGSALVLRIPPEDALDQALSNTNHADFTPDGRHVVMLDSEGRLEVWNPVTRTRETLIHDDRIRTSFGLSYAVSPDSATLAVGSGRVTRWSLPDLAPMGEIDQPGKPVFLDENRLIVQDGDRVSAWDSRGRSLGTPFTVADRRADFAGAGDQIIAITQDKRLRRYDIRTGAEVPGSEFAFGVTETRSDAIAPAVFDDLVALYVDSGVEVWDMTGHERLARIRLQETLGVVKLRFVDRDEVELTMSGYIGAGAKDGGTVVQRWKRDVGWGLPALIGRPTDLVEDLDGPAAPGYANAGSSIGGLESGDPRQWLELVCGVVRRSEVPAHDGNLPDGAYRGSVC
ncbi:trypsin-like peptidase domain-containing protein [Saccharopolyspora sp. NPDC050389]|uniref:nSTAND1 domain-containing NTPase n=1 Tax=Saccharopolyspora sp. NPDC050389 TaxID=3155516 RepID=UPI0033FC6D93